MNISVQYSPPADVHTRPPNYRAGTSVSLQCIALEATGPVTYWWSSTSSRGCFVSGYSENVACDRLGSYDAGLHTCVASDGHGSGSATIKMNVIG